MGQHKYTFEDFGISGVDLQVSGQQRFICPRCTPERRKQNIKDLSVDAVKGVWFCHHCGRSGSLLTGWDKELCKANREYASIKSIKFPPQSKSQDKPVPVADKSVVSDFCSYDIRAEEHKLTEEDFDWFSFERNLSPLTLSNEGIIRDTSKYISKLGKNVFAYGFPSYYKFRNNKNEYDVVNIKWRTKDKDFALEKGCGRCVYRWHSLYDENRNSVNSFIITEGEIDALSAVEAGFNAVISVPDGSPNPDAKNLKVKLEFLEQIKDVYSNASQVILALDNDGPGVKMRDELIKIIGIYRCWTVEYPKGCKDLNDVLVKFGKDKVSEVLEKSKPVPVKGVLDFWDIKDDIINFYRNGSDRGILTGWEKFDKKYSIKRGEMNVVTGIPSHGKSSFIDAMLVRVAMREKWRFAVFSPENYPARRHAKKYIEIYTGRSFFTNKKGERLYEEDVEIALEWVREHFYSIGQDLEDTEDLTLANILEKVRACIIRYNIAGFVLDPWNEIEHNRPKDKSETEYISTCLTTIRKFARRFNVAVWIIAHPSKQIKKNNVYEMPSAYDISGSANWRNKADNIICVHRPDLTSTFCIVEVQKIKFKEVGAIGKAYFNYDLNCGRYEESDKANYEGSKPSN